MRVSKLPALLLLLLPFTAAHSESSADPMAQERLHEIITEVGSNVFIEGSLAGFVYDEVQLLCVSDVTADRMRIISAIIDVKDLSGELFFPGDSGM